MPKTAMAVIMPAPGGSLKAKPSRSSTDPPVSSKAAPRARAICTMAAMVPASSATSARATLTICVHGAESSHFGVRMNPEVYYIDRLPVHVDPMEFLLTGVKVQNLAIVHRAANGLIFGLENVTTGAANDITLDGPLSLCMSEDVAARYAPEPQYLIGPRLYPAGCISKGQNGEELAEFGELADPASAPPLEIRIEGDVDIYQLPDGRLHIVLRGDDSDSEE